MIAHAGDQQRDAATIVAVFLAEYPRQVSLFESDRYQDVSGRCGRKEQVPQRHSRCDPEGDEETQVERVADCPVEKRRRELMLGKLPPPQPGKHLTQAEEIEMIDEKRA